MDQVLSYRGKICKKFLETTLESELNDSDINILDWKYVTQFMNVDLFYKLIKKLNPPYLESQASVFFQYKVSDSSRPGDLGNRWIFEIRSSLMYDFLEKYESEFNINK